MSGKKVISHRTVTNIVVLCLCFFLIGACQPAIDQKESLAAKGRNGYQGELSNSQILTLSSLEKIDEYPLYTMVYQGEYIMVRDEVIIPDQVRTDRSWACSLFSVFGNPDDTLFGRNFDWDFSPGLLLYTDPPDGYKSVSMVDLYYLGFEAERSLVITDLPLEERVDLLNAPLLPFDGMNEAGLIVGMAAVPDGKMEPDPGRETVDSLMVIRMILDRAATIEEAVEIIKNVNIDMRGNYLHYLITEVAGRSALVEFSKGEIVVHYNTDDWQPATNFLLTEVDGDPRDHCWRYDLISRRLKAKEGRISAYQAMDLLESVAQEHTQWSIVYKGTAREIWIVMGGKFNQIYRFNFDK
jgi:hypothetical protein